MLTRPGPRNTGSRRRFPLALGSGAFLAWGAVACSLVVDADPAQCRSDDDCVRFGKAVCDIVQRVCITPTPQSAQLGRDGGSLRSIDLGAGGGVLDGAASDSRPGSSDARVTVQLDAAVAPDAPELPDLAEGKVDACPGPEDDPSGECGSRTCVPFDNGARLKLLGPLGSLRPLP